MVDILPEQKEEITFEKDLSKRFSISMKVNLEFCSCFLKVGIMDIFQQI